MNTINYSIFPPPPGGGPPQGHRPKRRRKNRDARKKDAEKKKEKEAEAKALTLRKALFWVSLASVPLSIVFSAALYGLIKLTSRLLGLTASILDQVIK